MTNTAAEIKLGRDARKFYEKLREPIKSRIRDGIDKLGEIPPRGDIASMSDALGGYRLKIGKYRILFDYCGENTIIVHEIGLRGQIYKKRR